MNNGDDCEFSCSSNVDAFICGAVLEAEFVHRIVESIEPESGGLFETIEGFKQMAHMIFLAWTDESLGLLHVDSFVRISVEECSPYIELHDF